MLSVFVGLTYLLIDLQKYMLFFVYQNNLRIFIFAMKDGTNCAWFHRRTSSASRMALPSNMKASTMSMMAKPGIKAW